ncbi:MAG: hypothetical protein Q9214_000911 [Letrouitia sp. 1 TL-2023]
MAVQLAIASKFYPDLEKRDMAAPFFVTDTAIEAGSTQALPSTHAVAFLGGAILIYVSTRVAAKSQLLTLACYQLTLHPLAKFPGPLIARVTDWCSVYTACGGDYRHLDFYKLHQKYVWYDERTNYCEAPSSVTGLPEYPLIRTRHCKQSTTEKLMSKSLRTVKTLATATTTRPKQLDAHW